jgi:hypothetical protein
VDPLRARVHSSLSKAFDKKIVDELLGAYEEAKRNYYLGGLRLSEVEGGRFCEAAFRMLQQSYTGKFLPLGKPLKTDEIIDELSRLPSAIYPEAVRIHIPRALRLVYDVRNKRDVAHLADGIDPNVQDATMVIAVLDWVLAEFVRLHHAVPADEAQRIVQDLVTRRVPAIQDFDGFPKVLRPDLKASDYVLILLYYRGASGATHDELLEWVKPTMRANLPRTLTQLEHDKAHVVLRKGRYAITERGMREVERRRLFESES